MSQENNVSSKSPFDRQSRKRKNDNDDLKKRSHSADHTYCTRNISVSCNTKKSKEDSTLKCSQDIFEVDNEYVKKDFFLPQQNGIPQICLNGQQYLVKNVPDDGNCLFHCFSVALHGSSSHVHFYRKLLANAVVTRWEHFKNMAEQCHGKTFLFASHYLYHMLVDNAWGTACEISAATSVFKRNITTFIQGSRYNEDLHANEVSFHKVQYSQENSSGHAIFLLLSNGHFQLPEANNEFSICDNLSVSRRNAVGEHLKI